MLPKGSGGIANMASLASTSTAPTECDRVLKVRGRLSRVRATTCLQGLSKTRWRFCGKPSHNRGQTTPGCRPKVLHCFGCSGWAPRRRPDAPDRDSCARLALNAGCHNAPLSRRRASRHRALRTPRPLTQRTSHVARSAAAHQSLGRWSVSAPESVTQTPALARSGWQAPPPRARALPRRRE